MKAQILIPSTFNRTINISYFYNIGVFFPGRLCEPISDASEVHPPPGQRPSSPFPRGKITSIFNYSCVLERPRNRGSQTAGTADPISVFKLHSGNAGAHLVRRSPNLLFSKSATKSQPSPRLALGFACSLFQPTALGRTRVLAGCCLPSHPRQGGLLPVPHQAWGSAQIFRVPSRLLQLSPLSPRYLHNLR